MEKLDYGKSLNFFNKWFYSCYFPAILVFAFYFINKYIINNLSISIILYVILIIIWIIRLVYVPKNKSLKYGIIFLVDNSTYYNDNRNLFF